MTVLWWTHAINGVSLKNGERETGKTLTGSLGGQKLHENDFICAAKTDEIASSTQGLKK